MKRVARAVYFTCDPIISVIISRHDESELFRNTKYTALVKPVRP